MEGKHQLSIIVFILIYIIYVCFLHWWAVCG